MKTTLAANRKSKPPGSLLRAHSSIVLDGLQRAPSRAMLYPVGFKPEDFSKPVIGIASSWSMVTPCNMHLDKLARIAEAGANEAGGKAIIFDTITVSDGISMGTDESSTLFQCLRPSPLTRIIKSAIVNSRK